MNCKNKTEISNLNTIYFSSVTLNLKTNMDKQSQSMKSSWTTSNPFLQESIKKRHHKKTLTRNLKAITPSTGLSPETKAKKASNLSLRANTFLPVMLKSTWKRKISISGLNWSESSMIRELSKWKSTNTKSWPSSTKPLPNLSKKHNNNFPPLKIKTASSFLILKRERKPTDLKKALKRKETHQSCLFKALKKNRKTFLKIKKSQSLSRKSLRS